MYTIIQFMTRSGENGLVQIKSSPIHLLKVNREIRVLEKNVVDVLLLCTVGYIYTFTGQFSCWCEIAGKVTFQVRCNALSCQKWQPGPSPFKPSNSGAIPSIRLRVDRCCETTYTDFVHQRKPANKLHLHHQLLTRQCSIFHNT